MYIERDRDRIISLTLVRLRLFVAVGVGLGLPLAFSLHWLFDNQRTILFSVFSFALTLPIAVLFTYVLFVHPREVLSDGGSIVIRSGSSSTTLKVVRCHVVEGVILGLKHKSLFVDVDERFLPVVVTSSRHSGPEQFEFDRRTDRLCGNVEQQE